MDLPLFSNKQDFIVSDHYAKVIESCYELIPRKWEKKHGFGLFWAMSGKKSAILGPNRIPDENFFNPISSDVLAAER